MPIVQNINRQTTIKKKTEITIIKRKYSDNYVAKA